MFVYPAEFFEDRVYKVNPRLCFVLMPFTEPWSDGVYVAIRSAVGGADFECRRADDDLGRIILRDIWERINEAAFVVADLTAFNPNVFYELGVAHTVGTPSIPIAQTGTRLPFDQQAYRALMYDLDPPDHQALRDDLSKWIANLAAEPSPVMMVKSNQVGRFNDWRTGQRNVRFIREDFSGLDMKDIDLHGGQLSETDFSGSRLDRANLTGGLLIRSTFRHSTLADARLDRANVSEADFEGADLTGASLRGATALRVGLTGCTLLGADVDGLHIDKDTFDRYEPLFEHTRNRNGMVIEL